MVIAERDIRLPDRLAARSFQPAAIQRVFFRFPELEFATKDIAPIEEGDGADADPDRRVRPTRARFR